jgi:hypothetical protein
VLFSKKDHRPSSPSSLSSPPCFFAFVFNTLRSPFGGRGSFGLVPSPRPQGDELAALVPLSSPPLVPPLSG